MSAQSMERGHGLAVAGLFLALTLLVTWPIPRELASALPGFGDSMLNAWILAWEGRAIGRLDFAGFFDTNIFYPLEGTLTYSELMLPQAIVATPVWLASRNPVLVFNFVLLASIWTTALATYLLAMRLTRDRTASFTAGAIFACCPFMLTHLPQVQTLFAAGIPLAFLFLHRFAESGATRDLVGFGAVFSVQALGNGYYAVYLALFGGLYLAFHAVRARRIAEPRFWAQAALVAGLILVVVGPVYWQYAAVAQASGFSRPVGPPTGLASYLTSTPTNWIHGRLLGSTFQPGTPGARLFPGVVAVLLAAVGLAGGMRWKRAAETSRPRGQRSIRVLELAILALAIAVVAIDLGGGFRAEIGGAALSATGIEVPLLLLGALAVARGLAGRRWPGCRSLFPRFGGPGGATYPALLAAAFVLSLGTQPYGLLRAFVPGFGNLRAPYRIAAVFLFALAILAAVGTARILERLRSRSPGRVRSPVLAAVALPALVVLEHLSIPLPLTPVPAGEDVPAVHRWLAEREDDPAIVFFPARIPLEYPRVLFSTHHWRRMVNGFSGYAPYLYVELAERSPEFPSPALVADLRALGVDLVAVETASYPPARRKQILARIGKLEWAVDGLRPLGNFDGVRVYELSAAADPATLGPPAEPPPSAPIERDGWSVRAEPPERAASAVDGDPATCWSAPMRPGALFRVDLGARRRIGGIVLRTGESPLGYPRRFRVEVSRDGRSWRRIARESRFHPPLSAFVEPLDMRVEIPLPATTTRHLRIVQERRRDELAWVICELEVLGSGPQ